VTLPERVFEPEEILRALSEHGVDFVVIGGIAVQAHGYIRSTQDLDLIARPTMLNLTRLSEALADLAAEPRGRARVNVTDPHLLRRAPLVQIMTRAGPLDLLNIEHVAGAPRGYDELREAALTIELHGMQLAVAGLSDLVRMKRAAGREHDLADIEALTRRPDDRPKRGRRST
jgi:predicted nucleotidyltransferase